MDDRTPFLPEVVPEGTLVHAGVFSPGMDEFFFTVSDPDFRQFDVYAVRKMKEGWGRPSPAFFNSEHSEHGVAVSADGKTIYFSSTRPAPSDDIAPTWHIWRSMQVEGRWGEPEFVDIPAMRDKLVSHPSLSADGIMFFHAGTPDYSDLRIYSSRQEEGVFQDPVQLPGAINSGDVQVTPHVAPDRSYLLFERPPDIYISRRGPAGEWSVAEPLTGGVNKGGKGNPFVTPDGEWLFFVAADGTPSGESERWSVLCVSTESAFPNN